MCALNESVSDAAGMNLALHKSYDTNYHRPLRPFPGVLLLIRIEDARGVALQRLQKLLSPTVDLYSIMLQEIVGWRPFRGN